MPDNPSRREVWEAVVASGEANANSVFEMSRDLAAMQARAEKAEESLDCAEGDHRFVLAETVAAYEAKLAALESRLAESERSWALRLADAESRLAERDAEVAVLARNHVVLIDEVAEQAPVVEAAERQADIAARLRPIDIAEDEKWLAATATTENAVTAMLAARSLRGAGEGGGA